MAGQPGPVQGVLALFNPLPGGASAIVDMQYTFGASRHVGDDEAHPREQLSPVPLHFGHHPPGPVPTARLAHMLASTLTGLRRTHAADLGNVG